MRELAGKECDAEWREVETSIGFQLGPLNKIIIQNVLVCTRGKFTFMDPVLETEGGWVEEERNGRQWNDGEREEREGGREKTKVLQPSLSLIHYAALLPLPAVRALVEISPG